ncbi:MAG: helix-turn-helix domain-containing protein [Rhodomicrobium sp.]
MKMSDKDACVQTWMRPAEAAAYLSVSQPFLAKLRCYGGGPRFHKWGKAVLYSRADLDEFIAARGRASTSDDSSEMKRLAR